MAEIKSDNHRYCISSCFVLPFITSIALMRYCSIIGLRVRRNSVLESDSPSTREIHLETIKYCHVGSKEQTLPEGMDVFDPLLAILHHLSSRLPPPNCLRTLEVEVHLGLNLTCENPSVLQDEINFASLAELFSSPESLEEPGPFAKLEVLRLGMKIQVVGTVPDPHLVSSLKVKLEKKMSDASPV